MNVSSRLVQAALLLALPGSSAAWSQPPTSEPIRTEPFRPDPVNHRPWSISLFTDDGGFRGLAMLGIAFEPSGAAWLSHTDGVSRFDGYRWSRRGVADGLPSPFVRCVLVERNGWTWVGTDRGLAITRGPDHPFSRAMHGQLAGPSVRRLRQAPDEAIWACCDRWPDPNGAAGLTRLDPNGAMPVSFTSADGLPDDHVYDCFFDTRGDVYALTSKGPAVRRGNRWVNPLGEAGLPDADQPCLSMAEAPEAGLRMIGGISGFYLDEGQGWTHRPTGPRAVSMIRAADARTLIAARGVVDGIEFYEWDGQDWSRRAGFAQVPPGEVPWWIEEMQIAPDGAVWVSSGERLIRWDRLGRSEWAELPGLPTPRFEDRHGRIWCSDPGLAVVWSPEAKGDGEGQFARLPDVRGKLQVDPRGEVTEVVGSRLRTWGLNRVATADLADHGLIAVERLASDASGHHRAAGPGADGKPRLAHHDGEAWRPADLGLGAEEKLLQLEPRPGLAGGAVGLISTSRRRFELILWGKAAEVPARVPLPESLQTDPLKWFTKPREGLQLPTPWVAPLRDGSVWCGLGTIGQVWSSGDATWRDAPSDRLESRAVLGVIESFDHLILTGTEGYGGRRGLATRDPDGTWQFRPTSQVPMLLSPRGAGPDQSVMFGYDQIIEVFAADRSRLALPPGIHSATSAVRDREGDLWIGTTAEMAFRFRPDGIPPDTLLFAPRDVVRVDGDWEWSVAGVERFRPRGTPRRMRFQWRVDGGPWSPPAEEVPHLAASRFRPGRHTLEARAIDEGDDVDPTPERLEFRVVPVPLQERAWFLPAVVAAVATLSGSLILAMIASLRAAKARRKAEAASRAKTAFLAAVSHELRTPLNAVLGLADVLVEEELPNISRDHARAIRESGRGLLALIRDLLDYTAMESGELRIELGPLAVAELVAETIAPHRVEAERKGLVIETAIAPEVPAAVVGDKARLAQALEVLLSNAVKFTTTGTVRVAVGRQDQALTLDVLDTGPGLPPALIGGDQPFRPFTLGDDSDTRRYGGVGMGLAVAARLARALGGRLEAANRRGGGARFGLIVPAPAVAAPRAVESAPPRTDSSFDPDLAGRHPLEILVAEDVATNRRVIQAMLGKMGYDPVLVADGHAAVDASRRRRYDLILMDLQMPEMDGLEATRRILAEADGMPPRVVALTANAQDAARDACRAVGMSAFLTKPLTPDQLRHALRETAPRPN